jgi:hypothetical protein
MERKTCDTCGKWTRDPPRRYRRTSTIGVCAVNGETRHEKSSCGKHWVSIGEAKTDPAPESGETT